MTALTTVADPEAVAARAATRIASLIAQARERRGVAHVALAGGGTPRRAYELLAGLVERWDGVELWFGDERCVAPDDEQSNYRMVREALLSRIAIDDAGVHRVRGELGPERAARDYARELCERVATDASGTPVLDVAVHGLGPDGHTASLFPGQPSLGVRDQLAVGVAEAGLEPFVPRVSLTLTALTGGRHVVVLAEGPSKAGALAAAFGPRAVPGPEVPASMLAPETRDLTVLIDARAAAGLDLGGTAR